MLYDTYEHEIVGSLLLVGDGDGLRRIQFQSGPHPLTVDPVWTKDRRHFYRVKAQLDEYFRGDRREFDLPLAPVGTEFQMRVWQVLTSIPYGKLVSYRWVADKLGNPKAVRAVGGANGKNPLPVVVPCHRVIGSDGTLTGFGGGLDIKERLIALENPAMASGHYQRELPMTNIG
jgi:methylated-DNA-[protein]-cysteine S-methyltransferase